MPPAGFEPAIPATKRPQTYALERAATGIDFSKTLDAYNLYNTTGSQCSYYEHLFNKVRNIAYNQAYIA
jgi:hypothetical protein